MKTLYNIRFLILWAGMSFNLMSMFAQDTDAVRTINIETAGTLPELLGDSKDQVVDLTLTGYVNGTDIVCMQSLPALTSLNLKDARMVAGGAATGNNGLYNFYAVDDGIGGYAFSSLTQLTNVVLPDSTYLIGEYAFSNTTGLKGIKLPESLTDIGIGAFSGSGLEEIVFPKNLTTINRFAFDGCSFKKIDLDMLGGTISLDVFRNNKQLEEVNIAAETITTGVFSNCTSLKKVTLGEGTIEIGRNSFTGCSSLIELIFPSTLTSVNGIFDTSEKIQSVTCYATTPPKAVTNIFSYSIVGKAALRVPAGTKKLYEAETNTWNKFFKGNIIEMLSDGLTVTDGIASIGGVTAGTLPEQLGMAADTITKLVVSGELNGTDFKLIRSMLIEHKLRDLDLENATIVAGGESYINIDATDYYTEDNKFTSYLFRETSNLKSIVMPRNVTAIDDFCFWSSTSLETIVLPQELVTLAVAPFMYCKNLQSVTLGSKVQFINPQSFLFMDKLREIGVASDNPYYSVTDGVLFNKEKNSIVSYPIAKEGASYAIPESVTVIADYAFAQTHLLEVKIPESVNSIGDYAFGQSRLRKLTLPASITTIGEYAFSWCYDLVSINIPASVDAIGDAILHNTYRISSIAWDSNLEILESYFQVQSPYVYNPNLLVYVKGDKAVPAAWTTHVVRDGQLEQIAIDYRYWFYAAKPFHVNNISCKYEYSLPTEKQTAAGWCGIALPFTVQSFSHPTKGNLAPFGSENADAYKPFWLRELTAEGFKDTPKLQANHPYVIAMPNNPLYDDQYNIVGEVTFSSQNITVPVSTPVRSEGPEYTLVPNLQYLYANDSLYVLNKTEYDGHPAGSVFVKGLRNLYQYDVYAISMQSPAFAPALYSIGGGSATALEKILLKEESTLKIYSQRRTLYIESDKPRSIPLYGTDGILVRSLSVGEGKNTIDNLPCGIYFLEGRKVILRD